MDDSAKERPPQVLQRFTIALAENCAPDPLQTILADMLATGALPQKPARVGDQLRIIVTEAQLRDLSAAPCVEKMTPGWQLLPDPKQPEAAPPHTPAVESLAAESGSEQTAVSENTGGISGIVTIENSSLPLPDMTVEVYNYPGDGSGWTLVDFVETALDGSFFVGGLASGDYRVKFVDWLSGTFLAEFFDNVFTMAAASDISVTDGFTTSNIDAGLDRAGHITGTVTGSGGSALENVRVCAYYDNGSYWQESGCDLTNDSGGYDLGGMASGTYRVQFSDTAGLYLTEYYNNAQSLDNATNVSVTAGSTTTSINAVLADSGHIAGTVTAENSGALLENVHVQAYANNGSYWENVGHAVTDTNGDYQIDGLAAGTYRVRIVHFAEQYIAEWYDDAPDIDSASNISVTASSTTAGINATLLEYSHISGTVTAENSGTPLAGIHVCVYYDKGSGLGWFDCVYTDANGGYSIGGLAEGTYRVGFFDYSSAYLDEIYIDAPNIDKARRVNVSLDNSAEDIDAALTKSGHISGTVTAENGGAPLEDIQVQIYFFNGTYWEYIGFESSDANGSYDIKGLATGVYRLKFFHIDNLYMIEWFDDAPDLDSAGDISVAVGSTTAGIDVALMENGLITGTVTAADGGAPLYFIEVCAYFDYGSYWDDAGCDHTDTSGSYNISGLATGTYLVSFNDYKDDYALQFYDDVRDFGSAGDVSITMGSTTSGVNAALTAAGRITGTVTAESGGALLAGIEVCASLYNGSSWTSHSCADSDVDGSYDIGGLPAGTYRVSFFDHSYIYLGEQYDDAPDFGSAINVSVTTGGTSPGIDAALAEIIPPANDDFDSAAEILAVPYDNTQYAWGATTAGDDPLLPCGPIDQGYGSVWYAVTPEHNVLLAVDTFGSLYDTILSIWEGSRGSLSAVACNDDYGGSQSALTDVMLSGGTTYYIEVAGYFSTPDALILNVFFISTHDNALNAGWNMISTFVEAEDPAVASILSSVVSDVELMKNDAGQVYWPAYGINQIGSWDIRHGYQIFMTNAADLAITGATVDPAQKPIDLTAGWSTIAYLRGSALPIDQALATISGQLVMAKNGTGQVYWPAYGINQIGDMQPGEGYQIYMNSSGELRYPGN